MSLNLNIQAFKLVCTTTLDFTGLPNASSKLKSLKLPVEDESNSKNIFFSLKTNTYYSHKHVSDLSWGIFSASCIRLEEYLEAGQKTDILFCFSRNRPLSTHLFRKKRNCTKNCLFRKYLEGENTYSYSWYNALNPLFLPLLLHVFNAIHSIFFPLNHKMSKGTASIHKYLQDSSVKGSLGAQSPVWKL